MALRRLLENLDIDFGRLRGPPTDPADGAPVDGAGQGARISLIDFRSEHLRSVPGLLALYRDAAARGLVPRSEHGLVAFLSTVAYCLRVGERPAALLASLLKQGLLPATLADEDRALAALKGHRAALRRGRRWLRENHPRTPSSDD